MPVLGGAVHVVEGSHLDFKAELELGPQFRSEELPGQGHHL